MPYIGIPHFLCPSFLELLYRNTIPPITVVCVQIVDENAVTTEEDIPRDTLAITDERNQISAMPTVTKDKVNMYSVRIAVK